MSSPGSTFTPYSQNMEPGLDERMSKNDILFSSVDLLPTPYVCTMKGRHELRQMQLFVAAFVFHRITINLMVLAA